MRRTCNLTLIIDEKDLPITDINSLLSINKKVEIFIGFTNSLNSYLEYPILWFPQGTFVIISPNITNSLGSVTVSLTLHDKMALLNGECGGILPAAVTFSELEDVDQNGEIIITYPTIYQIIQQLVNHFGGEALERIVIEDIDEQIKQPVQWLGQTPLYKYIIENETTTFTTILNANTPPNKTYVKGNNVGYILTDFIYPGELTGNMGESVTSILDKIKNVLGNYQYFYDINGFFHFREIKNYLNNSINSYAVDHYNGKAVYSFENANIINSFTNTPQYGQIKNDFVIWGKRTTASGLETPIRYHLAIDEKPTFGNIYEMVIYEDPEDGLKKVKYPITKTNETGMAGIFYKVANGNNWKIQKWNPRTKRYEDTDYQIVNVKSGDIYAEFYLSGAENEAMGLANNYYYTELKNEFPKRCLIEIRDGNTIMKKDSQTKDIDFQLDLIDSSDVSIFGVQNIGRRTLTIMEDSINCIFQPQIPEILILKNGETNIFSESEVAIVDDNIYSLLALDGGLRSAYEEIRSVLHQYTNYNQQISLSTLPVFYLQPNIRISIQDIQSGIFGDYIIQSISLPFDSSGTMTLSCSKAVERI